MRSLQYVKTKRASWLVLEVTDKLCQSMGLMYDYTMLGLRLIAPN